MYQAPRSTVEYSFWEALQRLKLDIFKLDSPFIPLSGKIKPAADRISNGGSIHVDGKSFDIQSTSHDNKMYSTY